MCGDCGKILTFPQKKVAETHCRNHGILPDSLVNEGSSMKPNDLGFLSIREIGCRQVKDRFTESFASVNILDYREQIAALKNMEADVPMLHPHARETSFKEFFKIKKVYSDILGMNYIDHFSINVAHPKFGMLVFSINPELAYTLYATKNGVEQDLAISPTFYNNLNFYFWEDCYKEEEKTSVMAKKEDMQGILSGAVIVKKDTGITYLFSFGTKRSKESFMQEITCSTEIYLQMGEYCLMKLQNEIDRYFYPSKHSGDISWIK